MKRTDLHHLALEYGLEPAPNETDEALRARIEKAMRFSATRVSLESPPRYSLCKTPGKVGPVEIDFGVAVVHERLPPPTARDDAAAIINGVAYPASAFPVAVLVGLRRCVIELPVPERMEEER